jgi:hypothetical protein
VSGPRNRQAFARGQALRAEIRALLEQHPKLATPLTAREILARLSRRTSERTVQWHMRAIRDEANTLRSAQFIT